MKLEHLERVGGFLDTDISFVAETAKTEDYKQIRGIIEERTGLTIEQAVEILQGVRDCISDVIADGETASE